MGNGLWSFSPPFDFINVRSYLLVLNLIWYWKQVWKVPSSDVSIYHITSTEYIAGYRSRRFRTVLRSWHSTVLAERRSKETAADEMYRYLLVKRCLVCWKKVSVLQAGLYIVWYGTFSQSAVNWCIVRIRLQHNITTENMKFNNSCNDASVAED